MSILGSILSKIIPHADAAPVAPETAGSASAAPAATETAASGAPAAVPAAAGQPIDVAAVLDGLDAKAHQKLDWRHSIVDLMKLLGLDSSHSARIELAHELHYTGNTEDSAAMNIWLHAQVMKKLAENGGKVPEDLKHH